MWKFWIQNHFCAILGNWDIFKTKLGSEIDKFIFILTWSLPHSTRMALRCPISTLTDLIMSWEALRGPELPKLACQGWPGPDRGQLVHLGANLALLRPLQIIPDMTLSNSEFYFLLQISQPPNVPKNGSVFRIYIWISVFRRKRWSRNLFLGSWDIEKIQKVHFFWDAL